MKATIWKYPLEIIDEQTIEMPAGCYPLFVDFQFDKLCIWVTVPSGEITAVKRQRIIIKGTGHNLDDDGLQYVGSVMQAKGKLVWHIFWDNKFQKI